MFWRLAKIADGHISNLGYQFDLQKCKYKYDVSIKSILSMKRHFGAHLCTGNTSAAFSHTDVHTYIHLRVASRANIFEKSANQPTEKIYIADGNRCAAFSNPGNQRKTLNCWPRCVLKTLARLHWQSLRRIIGEGFFTDIR